MLLLGIDLGTSFIKVSVVDAETGECIASARNSDAEAAISSPHPGWAEQDPASWWEGVKTAIKNLHALKKYNPRDIKAIGISYQMHGLVLVDQNKIILRNSIIWCDSRAVETGNKAFLGIGKEKCLQRLLNSPGNFTASKLAWVKENEPLIYKMIDKILLPGDFIAMKLSGEINTTPSALSEGIFWDFKSEHISADVMEYFDISPELIPEVNPVFAEHGKLEKEVAAELSLTPGIVISYKAGDQLNNALSLNVLKPGEVAATAGTSGVIYAVTDKLIADKASRVNSFVHVNHSAGTKRTGVLLCINGCGIMNSWLKNNLSGFDDYHQMNMEAAKISPGSDGLIVLPFGNGAERILENRVVGSYFIGLHLTRHHSGHLCRAVQEGIAFAFRYGMDIMRENGIDPTCIRAASANMFLSDVFLEAFVNSTSLEVELFNNDGSVGAAIGSGIGAGFYSANDAFKFHRPVKKISVDHRLSEAYEGHYQGWKSALEEHINSII